MGGLDYRRRLGMGIMSLLKIPLCPVCVASADSRLQRLLTCTGLRRGYVRIYATGYVFLTFLGRKKEFGLGFFPAHGEKAASNPPPGVAYGSGRHVETISPSDLVEGVRVRPHPLSQTKCPPFPSL